tara:strand:- start:952 stop:1338 length:387 start_codon:yes stop_codon:yes gene_type:complete
MKRIIIILLISLASTVYALPNCPSDQSVRWHNCFGTYTWDRGDKYAGEYKDGEKHGQGTYTYASGAKYVGEHKDGEKHGQGTYTYPDGTKDSGYWMNDEYVPDICENMGLSKGTSEFGQCVLKLIDKL